MVVPVRPLPQFPPNVQAAQTSPAEKLLSAILKRDIVAARAAFDDAFWRGQPLKPDWLHLLIAVVKEDKPILKLLKTHDAKWTEEEFTTLCSLLSVADKKKIEQHAGKKSRLKTPDAFLSALMAGTIQKKIPGKENPLVRCEGWDREEPFVQGFIEATPNPALATKFLPHLYPDKSQPVDFEKIFYRLGEKYSLGGKREIEGLNVLLKAGYNVKPIPISRTMANIRHEVIAHLVEKNLLAPGGEEHRLLMIRRWIEQREYSVETNRVLWGGGSEKSYQDSKKAVAAVLKTTPPVTKKEIEELNFLRGGNILKPLPEHVARVLRDLEGMGFFKSTAWTKEKLVEIQEIIRQLDFSPQEKPVFPPNTQTRRKWG